MTQSRKNEIMVGIFVLIALVVMFMMTFIIRGSTGMSPYVVRTEFPDVAGLEIGSPVLVQGFRIGRVVEMTPGMNEEGVPTVVVISKVARTIPIHNDATVTLAQQGFIGDKRLEIDPGTAEAGEIESGQMITSIPPVDFMAAFDDAGVIVEDLKATLKGIKEFATDEERLARIDRVLLNIDESTARLNTMLAENETYLRETMENVRDVSERSREVVERIDSMVERTDTQLADIGEESQAAISEIRASSREISDRIDKILVDADGIGGNANELITTSREEVQAVSENLRKVGDNLNQILEEINEGKGSVGRLIKDPQPLDDLQASVSALRNFLVSENPDFYDRRITYRDDANEANSMTGNPVNGPE